MADKRRHKRSRQAQNNIMVLRLLLLVVVVLVVFEGKLIVTMFSQRSSAPVAVQTPDEAVTESVEVDREPVETPVSTFGGNNTSTILAGLPAGSDEGTQTNEPETEAPSGEYIDDPNVVPEQANVKDDSFFADSVFIGDSRMEGFRNTSGITQGAFMTSVGMSLDKLPKTTVNTPDGEITIYQGLSGKQYDKIYIMLGTNDLGYYPWDQFLPNLESIMKQMHELQPGATIYLCSVIYLEQDKITAASGDYVNNDNVQTVNNYLLQACNDLDYCYYLNLNEIFSNGYHALIQGASQDGIHLYEKYTKQMLDYLKNHYIEGTAVAEEATTEGEE